MQGEWKIGFQFSEEMPSTSSCSNRYFTFGSEAGDTATFNLEYEITCHPYTASKVQALISDTKHLVVDAMKSAVTEQRFCDVILQCDDGDIYAHKIILSSRSKVSTNTKVICVAPKLVETFSFSRQS